MDKFNTYIELTLFTIFACGSVQYFPDMPIYMTTNI